MQQLEIKVRARSTKEALNLGFIVARHYFFTLLFAALPLWLLVVALSVLLWGLTGSVLWMLFLLWWLKPLYERPVLVRLSRVIFSQESDWKSEQKAAWASGWLAELTYLRFFRSFAPVRHAVNCLEGATGAEKRARLRFLAVGANGGGSAIVLLSFLETALMFIIIWLLFDVSLKNLKDFLEYLLEDPQALHRVLALSYALLALLGTVFYISAGFMIYLNWRVISEGWAVAVDMQRLAKRLVQALCLVALGLSMLNSTPSYALSAQEKAEDKAWVEAQVQGKNGPYSYAHGRQQESALPKLDNMLPNTSFSQVVKISVISLALIVLAWVIYHILRGKHFVLSKSSVSAQAQVEVSVEQAAALETLQMARQLAEQGKLLSAVAILYAHWRQDYQHYQLPAIEVDETESDYLARVQMQASAEQWHFLQQLFVLWQHGAYAQLALDKAQVMALLNQYQQLWRGR